jgi:phosphoinositide-3-kinase regulatory subunit 4
LENWRPDQKKYSLLEKNMDIFTLGCVIAEIFMDGDALFDLSRLREYGRGDY